MNQLRFLARFVISQMRLNPGRALITMLGIVASTCAVIWVVSGYDALVGQFDENSKKYLGRYDLLIAPKAGPPGSEPRFVQQDLIDELKADAGVLEVNPISQARVTVHRVVTEGEIADEAPTSLGLVVGARPPVNGAPPIDPTLISTPAAESPYEVVDGRWLSESPQAREIVLGELVAKEKQLKVGDELRLISLANDVQLSVVGIVEQAPQAPSLSRRGRGGPPRGGKGERLSKGPPGERATNRRADPAAKEDLSPKTVLGMPKNFSEGIAANAIYVRPDQAAEINGYVSQPNVLQITVRDTIDASEFADVWAARLAERHPPMQLIDFDTVREGMETTRSVSSQRSQAWAATGMATLAAIFIIFSTLSMGVSERTREFAMLRAVALTKKQIAAIITIESVLLAVIGWVGGLVAGWGVLSIGRWFVPGWFGGDAVLGWGCVLLSGFTVLIGSLAAAFVPAWRATRIEPFDAMSTRIQPPQRRAWVPMAVGGALLSAFTPLVVFALPMSDEWRTWFFSFLAYPVLLVGMIGLAPAIIVFCERTVGPWLTRALGIDTRLMKTQLSTHLWRTVGATLTLSIGLGLYASTQTWGYSMLRPFTPGDWLPDALVAFHPGGVDETGIDQVRELEGVNSQRVMPLAIEQARFDWGDADAPSRVTRDNAVLFGVDPSFAFGSDDPLVDVDFVRGDRESAVEALLNGGSCLISEDFHMSSGLDVGDEMSFTPPTAENKQVTYRVAGIVSLPGWHWVTKFSGVRRHFVRTATMVFANGNDVQRDFHLPKTEFLWVDLQPGADVTAVESSLQPIAQRASGETFVASGLGDVKAYRPYARLTATETVRQAIRIRADDMIWGMSYLPLITLAIMSLAIANTVIASVRSRTREFGIMRSIGVTRGQLVRLVITETVLIGLSACVLSLVFGLIAGWCGVGMALYGGWFAGPPNFVIPWSHLSLGFAMTIGLCLLASVWPAFRIGRMEPLSLLRAGRVG
ncbi:FtsX-like permease family protein [Rhodopirellula sp. JC740]|uniref:FtsX-like permease family protein n=1 Tax=Rhodopirellula halodulae TaxID=2894198 RepID=A0ABS8NH10_9BACT|nr:FtsX family ABC transporter permease [Rhodopirellula sp. JC740]MCC9642818.1 FtsX-like permease family protein [Rhodopirellula sp. JC740]